jgi:hypothetical protein
MRQKASGNSCPAKRSRHRAPVHHRFDPAILEPAEFQASARDEDVSAPLGSR